jgi:hypothetical protein
MSKMWWESVESFTADLSGANEARLLEMGTGPSSSKPRPIDADPEWIRWWSGSPVTTIELYPLPDGEVDVVSVYRESDRMRILGSSRALFACLEPASTREESERMLVEPPSASAVLDLLRAIFTGRPPTRP